MENFGLSPDYNYSPETPVSPFDMAPSKRTPRPAETPQSDPEQRDLWTPREEQPPSKVTTERYVRNPVTGEWELVRRHIEHSRTRESGTKPLRRDRGVNK